MPRSTFREATGRVDDSGTATTRASLLRRGAAVGAAVVGAGALAEAGRANDDGPLVFNVADEGAVPNGTTDNTAILQGLLDQIRDSSGGGALYFPYVPGIGGVYLTRGLWVPSYTRINADPGIEIRAIGPSLDMRARSNGSPIADIPANGLLTIASQEGVRSDLAHPMERIEISGQFTLNGNDAIPYCLLLNGSQFVQVKDVTLVTGALDNVMVEIRNGNNVPGNQNVRVDFHACRIGGAGRNGVALTWFRHISFHGCAIQSSRTFPAAGIDVEPNTSSDPIRGLTVRNCDISFNGRNGIIFNAPISGGPSIENTDHLIEGNLLYENNLQHAGTQGNQIQLASSSGQADGQGVIRLVGNAITRNNGNETVRNDSNLFKVIAVGNHFSSPFSGPTVAAAGNWS